VAAEAPATTMPVVPVSSGFGDSGFDSGSFGWSDTAAETAAAGLSVLFVSTTKERTARVQGILAGHRRDVVLTTVMHTKPEAIAAIALQHDVLLFDFSIGPEALERTLSALRTSPLGASIAILVPQQTALPPAVSSLANACVIESTSGDMLVAALRDAAWTPWQPVDGQDEADAPRPDLFWKAFDALPVPVLVVDDAGAILHANRAGTKLADGVVNHVLSVLNPHGAKVCDFRQPTKEEAAHDFLWRVHPHAPARGEITIFNRSHYEDVLVPRVHKLIDKSAWEMRFVRIREFEEGLADNGTKLLKFFLHIGEDEQLRRFAQRLDDPHRNWKISESDYTERAYWDAYMAAYEDAIRRTSTKRAPWFVIPADHKWFRNLAVSQIIVDAMEELDMAYPKPSVDLSDIRRKYHAEIDRRKGDNKNKQ
jgi:PPK2 family polyphosphate:nucleotide phosphotransferase